METGKLRIGVLEFCFPQCKFALGSLMETAFRIGNVCGSKIREINLMREIAIKGETLRKGDE